MLLVTFQCSLSQISRFKKKLILQQITTFTLLKQDKALDMLFFLNFFDFSNMWKKFSIKIGKLIEDDCTDFQA